MLYNGEHIGDGSPPAADIAVDPLEGTELCAKGLPNAIATIALSERGHDVRSRALRLHAEDGHVAGSWRACSTSTGRSAETLELMAKEKGVPVGDLVVIMLDRPRHEDAMKEIREVGARIRLIPHGDVSAALAAVTAGSPVDLLYGIGGTPEGVLAAAAIQCTGGQILGRLWPRTRRGAQRRARGGLRPRRGARQGPARLGRRRLLRRHRRDRRRDARWRALHRSRGRDDRVDLDALALRHGAHDHGAPRPREAARDPRRAGSA